MQTREILGRGNQPQGLCSPPPKYYYDTSVCVKITNLQLKKYRQCMVADWKRGVASLTWYFLDLFSCSCCSSPLAGGTSGNRNRWAGVSNRARIFPPDTYYYVIRHIIQASVHAIDITFVVRCHLNQFDFDVFT